MYDPLPFLLAQAAKPAAPAPAEAAPGDPKTVVTPAKGKDQPAAPATNDWFQMALPFIAIAVVFYLIVLRPQRNEQKTKEEMLKNLKKNDRVLTIGGIIGHVANISQDGKEVTLKIDDNARMHVIRSAIQAVLTGDPKPGESKSS